MLLYCNLLIEVCEVCGVFLFNLVWISGCGMVSGGFVLVDLLIDECLCMLFIYGDWVVWVEVWWVLDVGLVMEVLVCVWVGWFV